MSIEEINEEMLTESVSRDCYSLISIYQNISELDEMTRVQSKSGNNKFQDQIHIQMEMLSIIEKWVMSSMSMMISLGFDKDTCIGKLEEYIENEGGWEEMKRKEVFEYVEPCIIHEEE